MAKTKNKKVKTTKGSLPAAQKSQESTQRAETKPEVKTKTNKKIDDEGTSWYVVHTYSGHENKVAATLRQKIEASHLGDQIFEVMVPTQEKIEVREGKKQTIRERIFPGYVLVKMKLDDSTWHAVRSTAGVTGLV